MASTTFEPFESNDSTAHRLIASVFVEEIDEDEVDDLVEDILKALPRLVTDEAVLLDDSNIASQPDEGEWRYAGG